MDDLQTVYTRMRTPPIITLNIRCYLKIRENIILITYHNNREKRDDIKYTDNGDRPFQMGYRSHLYYGNNEGIDSGLKVENPYNVNYTPIMCGLRHPVIRIVQEPV